MVPDLQLPRSFATAQCHMPCRKCMHLRLRLAVGDAQMAVCALELFPEARKCGHDLQLGQGAALGTVVMAWTLYVGI